MSRFFLNDLKRICLSLRINVKQVLPMSRKTCFIFTFIFLLKRKVHKRLRDFSLNLEINRRKQMKKVTFKLLEVKGRH